MTRRSVSNAGWMALVLGLAALGLAVITTDEPSARAHDHAHAPRPRSDVRAATSTATQRAELLASSADLRRDNDQLRAELEALQRRIAYIELTGETYEHFLDRCARGQSPCPRVDQPPELLEAMARCGTTIWDGPFAQISDAFVEQTSMTPEERKVLEDASRELPAELEAERRALLIETLGASEAAAWIDAGRVESAYHSLPGGADSSKALLQLARERAGLDPRPTQRSERSPYYWHMRSRVEGGDRLEARVAEQLGKERAHELRAANDGWLGGTTMYSAGACSP